MANKPASKSTDKTVSVLSEAEIAKLKAKHGKLFVYTTEDGKIAYFRKPRRQDVAAAAVIGSGDQIAYRQQICESCFVTGDRDVLDVDDYFFAIQQKIEAMITVVDGELKEL